MKKPYTIHSLCLPPLYSENERSFQGSEIMDGDIYFRLQYLVIDLVLLLKGVKFIEREEEKLLGF